MNGGLIIEGVTGAGKSSTLDALSRAEGRPHWLRLSLVLTEDETLGEFMDKEWRDPSLSDEQRCFRLHSVMRRIDDAVRHGRPEGFVLERFHLTYFVFMPRWHLYAEIDRQLARCGFRLVLLTIPEREMESRSLYRPDREGTEWVAGMTGHYGSASAAVDAIASSQRARLDCITRTALPTLVLDTSDMDWHRCAQAIAAFAQGTAPNEDGSLRH